MGVSCGTGVSCATGVGGTGVSCGTGVGWTGVFCGAGVGRTAVGGISVFVETGVLTGVLAGTFSTGWEVEVGVINGFVIYFVAVKDAVGVREEVGVGIVGVENVGVAVTVGVGTMIRCLVGMMLTHGAVYAGMGV